VRVALPDGTRIFFEVIGRKLVPDGPTMRERPTLHVLHGGPGFDHTGLASILEPLADEVQLVFLDHRGQGRSDGDDPADWNLRRWVPDISPRIRRALQLPGDHRFANGFDYMVTQYDASVYAYVWSGALAQEAFKRFNRDWVFNAQTGREFRATFFAPGAGRPLLDAVEAFIGRPVAGLVDVEAGRVTSD